MDITRYTMDYKGLPFSDPDGEYVRYEEVKDFIEGAKNTEQANQSDSQYDLGGLILPGSMWAEQ